MSIKDYVVKVKAGGEKPHTSTGYIFNSACNSKTLVLTSKHSICLERVECSIIKECACRPCPFKNSPFNTSMNDILVEFQDNVIVPQAIYFSERMDVAILEVEFLENIPRLRLTSEKTSTYFLRGGYRICLNNSENEGDGLVVYNFDSNATANLVEKNEELKGFSGSLIYKEVEEIYYAQSVFTDDVNGNDIRAELLNDQLIKELNELSNVELFQKEPDLLNQMASMFRNIATFGESDWIRFLNKPDESRETIINNEQFRKEDYNKLLETIEDIKNNSLKNQKTSDKLYEYELEELKRKKSSVVKKLTQIDKNISSNKKEIGENKIEIGKLEFENNYREAENSKLEEKKILKKNELKRYNDEIDQKLRERS